MLTTANNLMRREDYRAVKRMDRIQMSEYVVRIYQRGFKAGMQAAANASNEDQKQAEPKDEA